MSWRHAESRAIRIRSALILIDGHDLHRVHVCQKVRGALHVEYRIARFNAEKESIVRYLREAGDIEHRVMRPGKSAQVKRAHKSSNRSKKNRQLEHDDDEGRPAIQRTSADVDRVVDHRDVKFHRPSGEEAEQPAREDNRWEPSSIANGFIDRVNWIRRIGFHSPEAGLTR